MFKLNKKLNELDQRNSEIEAIIASLTKQTTEQASNEGFILDQEEIIVDPFRVGGYKNTSLPNGGVVKIKSQPLCLNGKHIIKNQEAIRFCSKCNGIFCIEHGYNMNEPICIDCLKDILKDFDQLDIYILSALNESVPLRRLKKALNISNKDISINLSKLLSKGCIKQDLFLRYHLTIQGGTILFLGVNLYDITVVLDAKKRYGSDNR